MSDSKRPPVIESNVCDLDESLDITESVAANDTEPLPSFRVIERADSYWAKLTQMPMMRRPDVDAVCNGDELLICEFSSLLKDFGVLGVEIVLNFRDIYEKADSTVHSKLGEIALIRGVIKLIRNFGVDMCATDWQTMTFLKDISATAHCQDLRQLTDLMINVQYLIQQGARCGCLERALTINWNYLELMLFLENYRCVMSMQGTVIAGEQMKAYLFSAQEGEISRKFLN